LRKYTSSEDYADILKNAKPPYNDLADKLESEVPAKDDDDETPPPKKETKKDAKKEEPEAEETPADEEGPEADEQPEAKKEVKEEKKEEKKETTNEDINQYECRGEHDKDDEACSDCPVKPDCVAYQPIYKKAKELKIDVGMKRPVEDIEKDVKAAEKPKAAEGGEDKPVKRKKLPF